MYGQATLDMPQSGSIGPSHYTGLSDELATVMGLTAAWSLSEGDDPVVVVLSDGERKVFDPDVLQSKLSIGHLDAE